MNREAHVASVLPPPPAEVDAADLGGRRIAELQQRLAAAAHLRPRHLHHAVLLGELVGGEQFVAQPLALLVVGGDALGAAGVHLLDLIQPRHAHRLAFRMLLQRRAAVAAELQLGGMRPHGHGRRLPHSSASWVARVAVPAATALSCRPRIAPLHLVGVALVIDQRVGPELADAHKARPGDEGAAAHLLARAGDVGHQRQPREVVARHEALAGQVAVGAEVVVVVAAAWLVGQQQLLLQPCRPQALIGRLPFPL